MADLFIRCILMWLNTFSRSSQYVHTREWYISSSYHLERHLGNDRLSVSFSVFYLCKRTFCFVPLSIFHSLWSSFPWQSFRRCNSLASPFDLDSLVVYLLQDVFPLVLYFTTLQAYLIILLTLSLMGILCAIASLFQAI